MLITLQTFLEEEEKTIKINETNICEVKDDTIFRPEPGREVSRRDLLINLTISFARASSKCLQVDKGHAELTSQG